MASLHPIRKAVAAPEIPDKLYFRIGEVAKLCGVAAYVLRFWETEFPQLKPNKGGTGQRLYRRRDVEMALRIKHLLYEQGFTIPGARGVLKEDGRGAAVVPTTGLSTAPSLRSVSGGDDDAEGREDASVVGPTSKTSGVPDEAIAQLRAEMQELYAMLGGAVGPGEATGSGIVKAMRPKLVEMKMAAAERAEAERAAAAERLRLAQGDLFGGDLLDGDLLGGE